MPPAARKLRTSSGPAAKGSQKTLSFGNSKVTKPTTSLPGKSTTTKPPQVSETLTLTLDSQTDDISHPTSEEAAATAAPQPKAHPDRFPIGRTPDEQRAAQVTQAQIKRYWRERENERAAPRVHQEHLGVEEKILRLFDMSSQYGPCIGLARMKRWVRAKNLGLNPPIEVLAVLLKEKEKGNGKIERAHVDELMSSKFAVEEV